MGTVYLCMKFQDKKTYVVKTTNYFARKFDYYNMKNFFSFLQEKKKKVHDNQILFVFLQRLNFSLRTE